MKPIVNFLYDDSELAADASDCIGSILLDEEEADAVRSVIQALDRVIDKPEAEQDDFDYVTDVDWPHPAEAARAALTVFQRKAAAHPSTDQSDVPDIP